MIRSACALTFGLFGGCGGAIDDEPGPISVSTETFSVAADPPGGTFSGPVTVALFSERPATIYYTTNGDAPADKGIEYTGPIEVEGDVMLNFAGVDEDGVWSRSVVEHYDHRGLATVATQAPRILSLSRPQLYFSARPGEDVLEQTVFASSVGSQPVLLEKVGITAARETGGFYEPGVFRLLTPIPEMTVLAPGETLELRIQYHATETLRSASLLFETDDLRTETGHHEVRLSGRIFNW